jgi:uncharacterized radical SAM superfamily Fe-S cluster-containing enzyme
MSINDSAAERIETTESLCLVCLEKIPARRVFRRESVFLEKACPKHDASRTRIWRGRAEFGK